MRTGIREGIQSSRSFVAGVLVYTASLVFVATSASAQIRSMMVRVQDPRPVARAVEEIEKLSGMAVNYEDIRYEHEGDIDDVTSKVASAESRLSNPQLRVWVPRGGDLSFEYVVDDVFASLTNLVTAYQSAGFPGRYKVLKVNETPFVVPSEVRNANGLVNPIKSILDVPISLHVEERSAPSALSEVFDSVQKSTGYRIEIRALPIRLFTNPLVIEASGVAARDIVSKVFSRLLESDASVVKPKLSYQLLFDPALKYYMFNVHIVRSRVATEDGVILGENPSPLQSPAASGRWFRKQ